MFEKATRRKLRISTTKGLLSVEDLWDLSLIQLNDIAKILNKQIKDSEEVSFISSVIKSNNDENISLSFEIVKHIINVKLEEKDTAEKRLQKKQERKRLLDLIERKKDEELNSKSISELLAKLEALDE